MKSKLIVAGAALALVCAAAFAAGVNYQLLKKVPVPGTGGWDYVTVDDAARRVYISHAIQVDVLDADSLALVGTIPNTPGVHGVSPSLRNPAVVTSLRENPIRPSRLT